MKKAPHTVASKRDTMAPGKREKAFGRHRKDTENGLSPRGQCPSPTPEASHQAAVSDLKAHTAKRQGATRSAWGLPRDKNCKVRRRNLFFAAGSFSRTLVPKEETDSLLLLAAAEKNCRVLSSCNLGMSSRTRSDLTSNHRCCGQAP